MLAFLANTHPYLKIILRTFINAIPWGRLVKLTLIVAWAWFYEKIMAVIYQRSNKPVSVLDRAFQPRQLFNSKAGAYPSEVAETHGYARPHLQTLDKAGKGLQEFPKTLAYYKH